MKFCGGRIDREQVSKNPIRAAALWRKWALVGGILGPLLTLAVNLAARASEGMEDETLGLLLRIPWSLTYFPTRLIFLLLGAELLDQGYLVPWHIVTIATLTNSALGAVMGAGIGAGVAAAKSVTHANPRRLPAKLCIVWLAVVLLSAAFGLPGPYLEHDAPYWRALEGVAAWASLGIGVATCLTFGLLAAAKVKSGRWRKSWAVLLLLVLPAPCVMLTHLGLWIESISPLRWYSSEGLGYFFVILPRWSLEICAAINVVLILWIVACKVRAADGDHGDPPLPAELKDS